MTINVHEDLCDEYVAIGMIEVGRLHYDGFDRVEFADPSYTCLHRMRSWTAPFEHGTREHHGFCLLDKNHRGRHATVVHYCDVCGKTRRGYLPAYWDDSVSVCWFCKNVTVRA